MVTYGGTGVQRSGIWGSPFFGAAGVRVWVTHITNLALYTKDFSNDQALKRVKRLTKSRLID